MDSKTQQKLLDLVKKNYEEIADDFNQTRRKALWPELIKLVSDVKDGDSVLDVGCGNGRLLEAFRQKKIEYFGIDQNEKLIEIAAEKFQITGCRFQRGDIIDLDKITTEKFDWIFCIAVFHHLPGYRLRLQALEQLKNRLKPGGKIVFTVWNLWSQWKYLKLILGCIALKFIGKNKMEFGDIVFGWGGDKSIRYYHIFRKRELKTIISRANLKIERLYKDRYNYYAIIRKS